MTVGKIEVVLPFHVEAGIEAGAEIETAPHGELVTRRVGLVTAGQVITISIDVVVEFGLQQAQVGIERKVVHCLPVHLQFQAVVITLGGVVDVVDEGFDLAIRATTLDDSSMIARRLCDLRLVVCATPELIEKHGKPTEPHHLSSLPCIADTNIKNWTNWPFIVDGKHRSVPVSGSVQVNNAAAARVAGLHGLGFVRSPFPLVEPDIEAGRLIPLLEEYELQTAALMAMYPHKRYLSPTVRALIDHLVLWFK